MPTRYDYIQNRLRLRDGSTSTSGGWNSDYVADTFGDLPDYSTVIGEYWLVDNASGHWYTFNRKEAGIYKATATGWEYRGTDEDQIPKEYDYYVQSGDWTDLKTALESGLYASVFIPNGIYTCTDNIAYPILVNSAVKRISGESSRGVILDANGAVNTNMADFITCHETLYINDITVDRFGRSLKAAFKGVDGSWYSGSRTNFLRCNVTNLLNINSYGFNYGTCTSCNVINTNSVGNSGYGYGFNYCTGVDNCRTEYVNRGIWQCRNVFNCFVYQCSTGVYGQAISNCVVFNSSSRSFDNCSQLTNCYAQLGVIGYAYCTGVDYNSRVSSCTTDFLNCTFNHRIIDNTDNTKIAEFDNSIQSTGTTRTHTLQDKDGTLAHLNYTEILSSGHTLTNTECFNAIYTINGTGTYILPAVEDGMSIVIITEGDVNISIEPNSSDKIWLDGVALDDGYKITNLSKSGDIAVLTYRSADGWNAITNGWADGGV